MRSKEKLEHYEEDNTEILEDEPYSCTKALAADIPESRIEIVPASQVTHLVSPKTNDITANIKVDSNYPLMNETRITHENEIPLTLKDNTKAFGKPVISELEPIQITQTEVSTSLDEYDIAKPKMEINATKGIVPTEGLITSEVLTSIEATDFKKTDQSSEKAKPNVIPRDALHVSENITSDKEDLLEDLTVKKLTATVGYSTLTGLNVTEVNEEMKEHVMETTTKDKMATSKLNFTLLESVEVGEVFVEDKSGKYYPELIVPTETAKKELLVSNQLITEIHNLQEKEGSLATLKIPQTQEANIDVTSTDSIVVKVEELHEKEGQLPKSEMPTQITVDKDVMLHTSLCNTIVTSQLKETEFTPEPVTTKKATIGVTEHQHKFNTETNIQDSENVFEKHKSAATTQAEVSLSLLDNSIIEEVQINESEKELLIKDDVPSAKAEAEFKSSQPIVTSQILELTSTGELGIMDKMTDDTATETIITECAKIVMSPLVHDQETTEDYKTKKPENITTSLVPNVPITVSEIESNELESKLNLNKLPDKVCAKQSPTHHLKTPLSEEITTADQYDSLKPLDIISEKATEQRDLQKEIRILQTTVDEQLQKLDQNEILHSNANATFIGNESIKVTEIISNVTEENLEIANTKPNVFAKMDIDADHKIALTSEINLGDVLNPLGLITPKQEAASLTSSALSSLEVTETKVLDSQSDLSADTKPELKYLKPDVVSLAETINVTEVIQHEKETNYEQTTAPETCIASADLVGQPVAILSELIPDSSVGIAKEDNILELTKKATVENITHKEIITSMTNSNEKEMILKKAERPISAAAMVNIDSSQALMIEENLSESLPTPVIQEKVLKATAQETTINKEAIIQQETVAHTSEQDLILKEKECKINPKLTLTALQVPEYTERLMVEHENEFTSETTPDHQIAESSVILKHGFETTEIVSQSENLEETQNTSVPYKKAAPKVDEIYGKTAKVQEIIPNQSAGDLAIEKVVSQVPDVSPVTSLTVEQTEIITAEKEMVLTKEITKTSNIEPQYSEKIAIITSNVDAVDQEQEFEGKFSIPGRKISVGIVPLSSTINSEVLLSGNTEDFSEQNIKTSTAIEVPMDLQKHIHETEVFLGEKESVLSKVKTDMQTASTKLTEVAATQITEINTVEKEMLLADTVKATELEAISSISEKQPLQNTEVIATMESEILQVSQQTLSNALLLQGEQEALQQSEPFVGEIENSFMVEKVTERLPTKSLNEQRPLDITEIMVTESENLLDSNLKTKLETLNPDFEKSFYVQISEIASSEREEHFDISKINDDKTVNPTSSITPYSSVGVIENIINEKEDLFKTKSEYKSQQAGFSVESQLHVTVIDNLITEKEEALKPLTLPSTNDNQNQDITLLSHLMTSETVTLEDSTEIHEKKSNEEKAKTSQDIIEAVNNEQQQVFEQIQDLIASGKQEPLQANQKIIDLKSLEQVEVIPQESSDFLTKDHKKEENASTTHTLVKELVSEQPHVVETTSALITEKYEPDSNQPSFDIETRKSCIITESIPQEIPQAFTTGVQKSNKILEQVIEIRHLEQTEVVPSENVDELKDVQTIEEKTITEVPHENLALIQSKTMVHEKETETHFEKPLTMGKVTTSVNTNEGISVFEVTQGDTQGNYVSEQGKETKAEKSITLLSHLQCTEHIPETHTSELLTHEVQPRLSNITSTSISPLIITDNTIFQKETDLQIQTTKKQTLRKGLTVANEIEVTTEFIDEQISPMPEKSQENIPVRKITQSEDREDVVISEQEVYTKEISDDITSPKSSDFEETEEIVTKFTQSPDGREPIQTKTKRTILRKKKRSKDHDMNERNVVIEETLDDFANETPKQDFHSNIDIEEYIGDEVLPVDDTEKSTVEMPEDHLHIPKLPNQVHIEEMIDEEIVELPDDTTVEETETPEGKKTYMKTKRILKHKKQPKIQTKEITTEQEDDKTPVVSVHTTEQTTDESLIPFETPQILDKAEVIEEEPDKVQVTQVRTETGEVKSVKVTKRVIKKKKGKQQEVTEITTTQQDDEAPVTTVSVTAEEIPEEQIAPVEIAELPEETAIEEIETPEGKTIRKKTIKRVVRKKGPKQETVEITTTQDDDKAPVTEINFVEEKPAEEEKPLEIVELPEETAVEETETPEGKKTHKKITRRIIKKKVGPKIQTTEITTEQEDDKTPVVSVHTTEQTTDESLIPFETPQILDKAEVIEEEPDKVQVTQVRTETGEVKSVKVTKRVIKKKKGKQQEVTEITTTQQDDEAPVTTVSVTAEEIPEEQIAPVEIAELPEETAIEEIETPEGKTIRKKTIKRVVRKKGPKQETVEITTTQDDDKAPVTEINFVEEKPAEEEKPLEIVELPEETAVEETETPEGKKTHKKITRRIIK
ncbi:titin-like, partial [Ostrinia furnacalis]|uniref:titin-like n=1 Tax=Ostrinia furnacalis TaxID=93504 RepID=UPI00103C7982